jgi:uncharacterized SAM-binding protein YcdF (DUF218 family)
MSNPENELNDKPKAAAVSRSAAQRSLLGRLGGIFIGLLGSATVVFLGGFLLFATGIPRTKSMPAHPADGIVALTGGASRISDAMELLADNQGKRLLISGVNPATKPGELIRLTPEYEKLFSCCIDLGHQALNTTGNALEIEQWARALGFRSLIVVTSSWHMPRALIELRREMPNTELIPYSVVTDRMRDEPWWTNGQTARLLMLEYLKYLAAIARIRLEV